MFTLDEQTTSLLAAAQSGDPQAFEALAAPHRRPLLAHCYRFFASVEDAEDLVQETMLRAWRGLDSYQRQAPFRAWLYKIATHACLDALEARRRRAMPYALYPPGRPLDPLPAPLTAPDWIEPYPDDWLDQGTDSSPEAVYDARESITFAFLAALQHLSGRQRAVLILRDVLGWQASETAETLGMTAAAVNSALQRARAALKTVSPAAEAPTPAAQPGLSDLLARYVASWEAGDAHGLVALLRSDAALTMPPFPLWLRGRADICAFLEHNILLPGQGQVFRLLAARANACPAFGVYRRGAGGLFRPEALQSLGLQDGLVVEINDFITSQPEFFARFGLPAELGG